MRKPATLLLVVLVALVAACGGSDTSEQIGGVWSSADGAYVEYEEDGQYQVAENPEVEGPFEWGDYTFDGETLTNNAASDSESCPNTSVTWTVAFSDEGDQADLTFVEDSCVGNGRSQDLVFVRP